MAGRRVGIGPRRRRTLRDASSYQRALEELEALQALPLGTAATEGLQDLIEAILDYEEKYGAAAADPEDRSASDRPATGKADRSKGG